MKPFLDSLVAQYHHPRWLGSDPVQYPHRFGEDADREIVAFLAACFAYGRVTLIHRAVSAMLAPMGQSPAAFVRGFDGQPRWPGFRHRFHGEGHVVALTRLLQRALDRFGTLGQLFRATEASEGGGLCERVLEGAARWFQEQAASEIAVMERPDLGRGMRFFFNSPADGSACKRMAMFLRWMSRSDEIDLGLWNWFPPSELVIPTDTHVARISYYLRLRGGKELRPPDWKMAREITRSLQRLRPDDPVAYDFALARLGILSICRRRYQSSICERCPVEPGCRFSNMI